jgi:hypothetical protein
MFTPMPFPLDNNNDWLSLSLYDDVKLLAASTAPPENVQTIEKQPNGGDPLVVPLQSVTFFSRNKRKILSFFFV